MKKISCFVAYPSNPPSLSEIMEGAIEELNKGKVVHMLGWKEISPTGNFIISSICHAIDDCDIFFCDLTHLNHNVLFELGYSIAKKKRIWITLDQTIESSRIDYGKFRILTTIGYSPYSNIHDIIDAFYKQAPYNDLDNTIYKSTIETIIDGHEPLKLLYLKSGADTEASVKLSRRVGRSLIPNIVDDPNEVRIQTLSWYAQKAYNAFAMVTHFLSLEHTEWRFHNAKNSFVSGLAYGFGKHLLMLAHEPYVSPIDYQDLLKIHKTAAQCESLADSWLKDIEDSYEQWKIKERRYSEEKRAHSELQKIIIGDPIAELEQEDLLNYFVQTAAYKQALESKNSIFIGRKGSGKTAIFYKLEDELRSDARNHVCIIKPIAYELEGILRMLAQTLPISEKGYLIESFWKFLIYTELAKSVFEGLKSKPHYLQRNDAENELMRLVESHKHIITDDFSIRLESVVNVIDDISTLPSAAEQRGKISEILHEHVISRLRAVIGKILEKKNKVVVLIDNLDKAWNQRDDLPTLCMLLLGLLGVSQRISMDFQKSDHWRRPVNLSLIIFLRSDIFAQVIKYAPERDKITYYRIAWNDREVLRRVLEERFLASTRLADPNMVWDRYFCTKVKDMDASEYLIKRIIPRPRDLIYLSRIAIGKAINRRHSKVEEEDIIEAEKEYSHYALDSLLAENSSNINDLEELLYEFVGSQEVITYNQLNNIIQRSGIVNLNTSDVIDLLCNLTFIGREVGTNRFEFLYNEDQMVKFQVMARKVAEERADKEERFIINEAFHPYLEIVPMLS